MISGDIPKTFVAPPRNANQTCRWTPKAREVPTAVVPRGQTTLDEGNSFSLASVSRISRAESNKEEHQNKGRLSSEAVK